MTWYCSEVLARRINAESLHKAKTSHKAQGEAIFQVGLVPIQKSKSARMNISSSFPIQKCGKAPFLGGNQSIIAP
jgi:hypothetical protein